MVTERTGGCACGAVRFVARGEPKRVANCHCMTCRKAHGAPFVAFVIFADEQVTVTGELREWRASPPYARCFCPHCGSRVLGRENGETELSLGAFDDTGVFTPQYEVFVGHREPWQAALPVPQFPAMRGNP
ncbi:MAG: GFA family protein [Deltaproteobacteria bacterium]|nr:GFA family protein [Deltaproteobacteria bacterium]